MQKELKAEIKRMTSRVHEHQSTASSKQDHSAVVSQHLPTKKVSYDDIQDIMHKIGGRLGKNFPTTYQQDVDAMVFVPQYTPELFLSPIQ